MSSGHKHLWLRCALPVVLPLVVLLIACGSILPHEAPASLQPKLIEQPLVAPLQRFRIVQLCLDTPPLFPARFGYEAATALGDRVDSAVNVNFGGLLVYVSYITHDSYQNSALQFAVSSFGADPAPPTPPKKGDDPYANAQAQGVYQQAYARWQEALMSHHHQLAALRDQVKKWTNALRSLPIPYDQTGSDQFGCLQTASQHFQGVTGEKILLIASPLINNTMLQASNVISLSGARVLVIWHTCTIASVCQTNDATWKHLLLQDGAKSVAFYDVPQSEVEQPTF
jgi:hypothetical protein